MKLFKACIFSAALLGSNAIEALDQKPWMGDFLQFYLKPSFMYRHYPSVNRGFNPTNYASHDRFTTLDLQGAFLPNWDAQLEVEFADTSKQALGTQSGAVEVRYQWLNDISGDFISLTTGLTGRWVGDRSLRDVSCPYAARWNAELGNSFGREWGRLADFEWVFRMWAYLGVGIGNHGSPWITSSISLESLFAMSHKLELKALGYFGFGDERFVNVNQFYGYGSIFHQSVDLSLKYTYEIGKVWGSFYVLGAYRVLAKAFPEHAVSAEAGYNFPFSFF